MTPNILPRFRYLVASLLVVLAAVALLLVPGGIDFRAGAQTPEPNPTIPGKPDSDFTPPAEPSEKNWGGVDETPIAADPVGRCPLTSQGCSATENLFTQLETGNIDAIVDEVPQQKFPIGGKPGLQIVDEPALRDTLIRAREHLRTVAVGCPQATLIGPVEGACADVFVLAIDAVPESPWTVGFVFVNDAGTFALDRIVVQPQIDISKGGGSASVAIPYKGTEGGVALWYTPWQR